MLLSTVTLCVSSMAMTVLAILVVLLVIPKWVNSLTWILQTKSKFQNCFLQLIDMDKLNICNLLLALRFLFYLDPANIEHSMQICIKQCPDSNILTLKDLQNFYNRTESLLCR